MIVKLNRDLEYKLNRISKRSDVKKDELIEKIFGGFVGRYEDQNGEIDASLREKSKWNVLFSMLELFKEKYKQHVGNEYLPDQKRQSIDFRDLKIIKEKMMSLVLAQDDRDVIAIEDQDLLNAFDYFLTKMPIWWKDNMFDIAGLSRNFEKIMKQLKNGTGFTGKKEQLDLFINSFGD